MGREASLRVFIAGRPCGTLTQGSHEEVGFKYDVGYRGIPLSLSMPVGAQAYPDRAVRPYLMGLLPDDERTRAAIGHLYGVSGDNPFRLLEHIGLDCPGAVQMCPEGTDPLESRGATLVPLSEAQVAQRLRRVAEDGAAAWTGTSLEEGHWSLGGCQAKLALRLRDGSWHECSGSEATTHILKPGVAGMEGQALVEYLSMRLASAVGLPAAEVSYLEFEGVPAIAVKRYDREELPDGSVTRLHQEDLCQALGVPPSRKYAEQGGPSTIDVVTLLGATGANSRENVHRFLLYLFFNYLIGATDAHAKNHSLLLGEGGDAKLAPLYDVATAAPYHPLRAAKRKPLRAALAIGGENRFGEVGRENVAKLVSTCSLEELGLDEPFLSRSLLAMAQAIPPAIESVVAESTGLVPDSWEPLVARMVAEIAGHCARIRERFDW